METKSPGPRRLFPWLVTGAVAGGLFGALDGLIIGALVAEGGAAVLAWAGAFAAAGAVLGVAIVGIARAVGPRLVLHPPGEDKPDAP
jgi:hypothetical protein